jgi:hypothetical protein
MKIRETLTRILLTGETDSSVGLIINKYTVICSKIGKQCVKEKDICENGSF